MLPTIYAQKILGDRLSLAFMTSVLNGPVDIWNDTCTAINGWCSNEAVYKAWDAMGRPDTADLTPHDYDTITDPEHRRNAIAEARISAIAQIIQDQLHSLIIDMVSSGKLKVVAADPHGKDGTSGIIECGCYVMSLDDMRG